LPRFVLAAHRRIGKSVEGEVVGGMNRDQLALQMGRKVGQREVMPGESLLYVFAIGLTVCSPRKVE
jgi:hypothetical protein